MKIHKIEGAVKKRNIRKSRKSSGTTGNTTDKTTATTSRPKFHHFCCETVFNPEEYKIHLLNNHLYKCPVCYFQTRHKSSLNQHYKTHLPTCAVDCPDCGKTFKLLKSLKFHMKSIHQGKSKIYECSCGYKTIHKSTMRRHLPKCSKDVKVKDLANTLGKEKSNTAPTPPSITSPGIMSDEQTFVFSVDDDEPQSVDEDEQREKDQNNYSLVEPLPQGEDICQKSTAENLSNSPSVIDVFNQSLKPNIQLPASQSNYTPKRPTLIEIPSNQPSLAEWLTGYGHPRTLKTEKRKFSCHAPNCLLTFTRFYDFKRHFSSCHAK